MNFWTHLNRDMEYILNEKGEPVKVGSETVIGLVSNIELSYSLERGGFEAGGPGLSIKIRKSVPLPELGGFVEYNNIRYKVERIENRPVSPFIEIIASPTKLL